MALNKDFRVKDSLYVGTSGYFAGSDVSIDTGGSILSAGVDLLNIFQDTNLATLSNGSCIASFTYDGDSSATVAIESAAYNSWDYAGNNITNAVSGITTSGQGEFDFQKIGNASNVNIDLGLQPGDSPTFAGLTLNGQIDMTADKIVNVADPTNDQDVATKAYVDSSASGTVCSVTAGNSYITIGGTGTDPTVCVTDACANEWNSVYTTTNANSANWNEGYTKGTSAYTTVQANSASTWACDGTVTSVAIGGSQGITVVDGSPITDSGTINLKISDNCNNKWNSSYTTTHDLSSSWNSCATSTQGAKADSAYSTTNSLSSSWNSCATGTQGTKADSVYTTTNAKSASWDSVYTSYNSASGTLVDGVCSNGTQGNLQYSLNGSASFTTVDLNLCAGDNVTFLTVDGTSGVCGNNVTVGVAGASEISTSSGDLTIDSASGTTIVDDNLVVTGDSTIQGNLSVLGDFTCIETTVSITSALSVNNAGTGPALWVGQSGVQPIAHFIDKNGDDIVFDDNGKVGIGTFTPSEKLDVVGNITASGTLNIDSNATIDGTITAPSLGTGEDNSVVILDSDGKLRTDEIDSRVWGTSLVDGSLTQYCLPVACGSNALTNSCICQSSDSSLVTVNADLKVNNDQSFFVYANGGSIYSEEKTFTATVGTGGTTVATFAKSGFRTGKYVVSLINGVNRTSFEVLVTYNDTNSFGTVYGIVDAQATSQLDAVDVSNSSSTIDLVITSASASTTAIIHGKAFY